MLLTTGDPDMHDPHPASAALNAMDYRGAMARLGAAVNIVTTDGPAGRAGFTASAVCSVTDEPPTLLVCLNRSSSVHDVFIANGSVGVNTLASSQLELSRLFGGKTPVADRFAAAAWRTGNSGAPLLNGALVSFDCHIKSVLTFGTHDAMFCAVLDVQYGDRDDALLYYLRKYHVVRSQ